MTDNDFTLFDEVYDRVTGYFESAQQSFDRSPESGQIGEVIGGVVTALCDWLATREEIQKCADGVVRDIQKAVREELADRSKDMDVQANAPAPQILQ